MKKIIEFLRDNANRYSFHFLAWIVYIFVLLCYTIIAYMDFALPKGGTASAAYAWYLIFGYGCFYPYIFGLIAFIYARLRLKERKKPEFRIKNKFIIENLFYRRFIVFSVVLSILFFIALLIIPIWLTIANPTTLIVGFFNPLYKIFICIVILYLLAFLIK